MLEPAGGAAGEPARARLEARVLGAHARRDFAELARLYAAAGMAEHAAGRTEAACFFWTQGWIFALDEGDLALARDLEAQLAAAGRMPPPA